MLSGYGGWSEVKLPPPLIVFSEIRPVFRQVRLQGNLNLSPPAVGNMNSK